MLSNYEKMEDLQNRRKELEDRIQAIKSDIGSGLDPDSEEQAVQLENYEVLLELLRTAESELADVNDKIRNLEGKMYS